jgi:hypothetical protein
LPPSISSCLPFRSGSRAARIISDSTNSSSYPSNTLEGATGPNGIGRQGYSTDLNLLNENVLTWKQSFGDHNIMATAVASYQTDNFQSIFGQGNNFPGNGIQELSAASTPVTLTSTSIQSWADRLSPPAEL